MEIRQGGISKPLIACRTFDAMAADEQRAMSDEGLPQSDNDDKKTE